jgi:hypothetical protein
VTAKWPRLRNRHQRNLLGRKRLPGFRYFIETTPLKHGRGYNNLILSTAKMPLYVDGIPLSTNCDRP